MVISALLALSACDESKKPQTAATPPTATAAATSEPVKPKGPPELEIDAISPKVGFTRVLFDKADGRGKLAEELGRVKEQFAGREVVVRVDRKAQSGWAIAMLEELHRIGAAPIAFQTQTRGDLSPTLAFKPESTAADAAPCSVVATVLADRGTAVWKLSGGVASKRSKGFAGPDLTMTSDTIERIGKACKASSTVFVAGAPGIEWGLVYDLAAAAKKIEAPRFENLVLLHETPTAGRPVKLSG
jgi:hypothetical protein